MLAVPEGVTDQRAASRVQYHNGYREWVTKDALEYKTGEGAEYHHIFENAASISDFSAFAQSMKLMVQQCKSKDLGVLGRVLGIDAGHAIAARQRA